MSRFFIDNRDMEENIELIRTIREGNEKAFEELLRRYRRMIYKIIYANNLNSGDFRLDEEDLFQEGSLALYESVFSYEEERNVRFSTFAFRVIRNRIKEVIREQYRKNSDELYSLDREGNHGVHCVKEDPLSYHKEEVLRGELQKFVSGLGNEDRAILMMRKEEYSYKEISQRLGINAKRVDNRLRILKRRLKKQIQLH